MTMSETQTVNSVIEQLKKTTMFKELSIGQDYRPTNKILDMGYRFAGTLLMEADELTEDDVQCDSIEGTIIGICNFNIYAHTPQIEFEMSDILTSKMASILIHDSYYDEDQDYDDYFIHYWGVNEEKEDYANAHLVKIGTSVRCEPSCGLDVFMT
jgi:hypothetical protein